MKIELEIYSGGGFSCLSKGCFLRSECANHFTAGQFRGEDGFSPTIEECSDGSFICHTVDNPMVDLNNLDVLNVGAITMKDIETFSAINFQI